MAELCRRRRRRSRRCLPPTALPAFWGRARVSVFFFAFWPTIWPLYVVADVVSEPHRPLPTCLLCPPSRKATKTATTTSTTAANVCLGFCSICFYYSRSCCCCLLYTYFVIVQIALYFVFIWLPFWLVFLAISNRG